MSGLRPRALRFLVGCSVIATLFAAPGCFMSPGYPQSWPQLKQPEDVASTVEGSYECHGSDEIGKKCSIYNMLFTSGAGYGPRCDQFTIRRTDEDSIEIRIVDGQFSVADKIYDSHVEDNWIVLDTKGQFKEDEAVYEYSKRIPHIGVDSEKNLVVKDFGYAYGTAILVVPYAGSSASYCRFLRIR